MTIPDILLRLVIIGAGLLALHIATLQLGAWIESKLREKEWKL